MIWSIIHLLDILLWLFIAGSVVYVAFFALASLIKKRDNTAEKSSSSRRFLILFPAYHEDSVIVNSVEKFLQQDYPKERYQVAVISDHMSEATNTRLAAFPITLHQPVFDKSSKAKALQHAITHTTESFNNIVILDADNVVLPDFLTRLNAFCDAGYRAIQCHRTAKNADNDVAVLDGVSEEINNTLFRRAHNNIGLSSALIGSGMCFDYDLFCKNVFQLTTAGEDREMEALLLQQEEFIKYAADIHVYDEKVSNKDNFQRQRMRWMTAQVQSLIRQLPHIPSAIVHGNLNFIDKTIQQALILRSILIVVLIFMALLMTILAPTWSTKWWILLAVFVISLFIAIPARLRSVSLFCKILVVPGLVLRMLQNLLHMDHKNTDFLHTTHDGE